jgi:CheY-like chemotaxis protein
VVLAKKLQNTSTVRKRLHGAKEPTILVVEDDSLVWRLISGWLRNSGCMVLEASSGVEAVRAFTERNGRISLLVTDVDLSGGISGVELAAALESNWPALPVIAMSGAPANLSRGRTSLGGSKRCCRRESLR